MWRENSERGERRVYEETKREEFTWREKEKSVKESSGERAREGEGGREGGREREWEWEKEREECTWRGRRPSLSLCMPLYLNVKKERESEVRARARVGRERARERVGERESERGLGPDLLRDFVHLVGPLPLRADRPLRRYRTGRRGRGGIFRARRAGDGRMRVWTSWNALGGRRMRDRFCGGVACIFSRMGLFRLDGLDLESQRLLIVNKLQPNPPLRWCI
jgi:hypothetical protein